MVADPQPILTVADAIADCERSLCRPNGGLCVVSARSLGMLIESAKRDEAHRVDLLPFVEGKTNG